MRSFDLVSYLIFLSEDLSENKLYMFNLINYFKFINLHFKLNYYVNQEHREEIDGKRLKVMMH